jgi:hypothetical protein
MRTIRSLFLSALVVAACVPQSASGLAGALEGIERTEFIACSGPPILSYSAAGEEHIAFIANRAPPGTIGANVFLPNACSGNAVFANGKLASVEFRGNPAVCAEIFGPCLRK